MYWGFTYDEHMLNMQALAFNGEWENATILIIYFDIMSWRDYSMCSYERQIVLLINFYWVVFFFKLLKKECVYDNVLCFALCEKSNPYLQR